MTQPKNAMEVFRLLDHSNCRLCGEKTCLAFAGKVFLGQLKLDQCPKLDQAHLDQWSDAMAVHPTAEENQDDFLYRLKERVTALDLKQAARRIGAASADGKLTVKVLGKDFAVNSKGELLADIHVNHWIAVPFLHYVLNGQGRAPTGRWASFRELKEGRERYPLFQKRCEEAMKRVADTYPGLFEDMVHLFGGQRVEKHFQSDISVVLHPLPLVPLMVCYWKSEEGLASSLNLFFDRAAETNLDIDSLFTLGTGLAQMFTKLSLRHGFSEGDAG